MAFQVATAEFAAQNGFLEMIGIEMFITITLILLLVILFIKVSRKLDQEEDNEMLIGDRDFDEKIIGTCTDTNQENGIYLVEEGYELESSQSSKTENFPQEGNKIHQDSKSWLNSFVSFRRY